jgi:hypothetical protein
MENGKAALRQGERKRSSFLQERALQGKENGIFHLDGLVHLKILLMLLLFSQPIAI